MKEIQRQSFVDLMPDSIVSRGIQIDKGRLQSNVFSKSIGGFPIENETQISKLIT